MTVSKETPNKTSVFGCYVLSAKVTEKLPSQHCGLSWLSNTVETQFEVFFSRNLSIEKLFRMTICCVFKKIDDLR